MWRSISPFKNLFLEDSDYLKLLDNLELYLKNDLIFSSYGRGANSDVVYPIMKLMDIHIHFNHSTSIEDAVIDWSRRVKKVNHILGLLFLFLKEIFIERNIIEG